jgi:hypothetical protein
VTMVLTVMDRTVELEGVWYEFKIFTIEREGRA